MILNGLTSLHVTLSLIGIGSGVVAIYGLLKAEAHGRWTHAFLTTTAATSLTGFVFPFHGVTPAEVLGVLSLIALIIASLSIYRYHLQGIWRRTYICSHRRGGALFQRFRAGRPYLPPDSGTEGHGADPVEAAFQITQLAVLLLFAAIGIRAARAKARAGLVP